MIGRFTTLALSLLMASVSASPFVYGRTKNDAKSKLTSKLMRGAKPTKNSKLRRLDGDEYIPDITSYYLKFEQCQFVKAYDDEIAEQEDIGTVLATQRFVIFRLCPSVSSCSTGYGEYLVPLETYLEAFVQYEQEVQENMCQACEECGNNNNNNGGRRLAVDCDSCYDECQKIENMEENGYIDASEFLECQMIYDPEDDSGDELYAGPMCASYGKKIKIGVFTDEDCSMLDNTKDVEDYLYDDNYGNMKLSHALLKKTYDEENLVSCLQVDEEEENNNNNNNNNNGNNNNDEEPEVAEVCEQLYEWAAKCEKIHGFDNGYADYSGYENQAAQEEVVCDFIKSLESGTYDEEGEIIIGNSSVSTRGGGKKTTGGQKFALTFFILGTVGLAVYAAMLHSQLTKGAKADLSRQGGAMA